MSRTIRSESAAHTDQLTYIQARAATSADWRAVLATRDSKRTARHYRQSRKPQSGAMRVGLAMALIATGALAYRMQDACTRAAIALSSMLA